MRLVDRVSTDVLWDKVDSVVKIKDIIHSRLGWYGHVIHRDINSKIRDVVELEKIGKRKKN